MDNEQIKKTIEHFKKDGLSIRVRDIAYTLLSRVFENGVTAYQCLFGGDADGFEEYSNDPMRERLMDYLTEEGFVKTASTDNDTEGLTFEENRREMEALIRKTQEAMDNGMVDPKDGLKIMADVRVKLNDKFKVESKQQERTIVVNKKYNSLCKCGREIYVPTKEELMEEYNLIEKQE